MSKADETAPRRVPYSGRRHLHCLIITLSDREFRRLRGPFGTENS